MFRSFVPPPKNPLVVTTDFIDQVAGWLEKTPRVFMPPASDRATWDALPLDKIKFVQIAEDDLKQSIPQLTEELYLDFMESGQREPFTVPYNQWIDRASSLALAEGLEFKGRFLPALRETILEILSEPSWVYPMHDGPHGWLCLKGGQLYVDLGAAVRAGELATIDGWLGAQLGDDIRLRIREEVKRRVIDPYLGYVYGSDRSPGWWWVVATTNWNSVCHAGVAYATMALIEDKLTRAKVTASAARHTELYFEGFTSDGYISEGLGYWNYGFGHFTVLAETLLRATRGEIDLYRAHAAKVGAVASYPIRCEIAASHYPAFSDCPFGAMPNPWIYRILARHVVLPTSAIPSKPDYRMRGSTGYLKDIDLSLPAVKPAPRIPIPDYSPLRGYFSEAGILISRPVPSDRGIAMAAKGGHNDEMHNHNDVGSYTITCHGHPVLVDPGLEKYHLRTFSDQRYESNILNSYGHPVPFIDGVLQSVGRKAEARVLVADFTDASDRFVIDLTSAYAVPGLERVQRTFTLDRTGATALTVIDEINLSRPVHIETALITLGSFEQICGNLLRVSWNEGAVIVKIDTGGEPFSLVDEVIEETLSMEWKARRIGIKLVHPVQGLCVTFTITPP